MQEREVVVYSRPGCHLCDVVKETLRRLEERGGFRWRDVDIDQDPELRRLYGDQIPVVFVDGRKSFKYRMTEKAFLRRLEG
jgi:glutaredoxin